MAHAPGQRAAASLEERLVSAAVAQAFKLRVGLRLLVTALLARAGCLYGGASSASTRRQAGKRTGSWWPTQRVITVLLVYRLVYPYRESVAASEWIMFWTFCNLKLRHCATGNRTGREPHTAERLGLCLRPQAKPYLPRGHT